MVSIDAAFRNILRTHYSNVQMIQELNILKEIKPILETKIIGSINNIQQTISTYQSPFRPIVPETYEPVLHALAVTPYDTIQNKHLISPFQLLITQLSESEQKQCRRKLFMIRQAIQCLLFVFYTWYTLSQDQKIAVYFQIRQFFSKHRDFFTSSNLRILIHVFLLNQNSDFNAFRTLLFNAFMNQRFIQFAFSNARGSTIEQIILELFYSMIGQSDSRILQDIKSKLYIRYIVSFIQAPYMNEYREEKKRLNITQVLEQDLNVFVNPSHIVEFRNQTRSYRGLYR